MSAVSSSSRRIAVRTGVQYLCRLAHQEKFLRENGPDFLFCLQHLSSIVSESATAKLAHATGRQCARDWRRLNGRLPRCLPPEDIVQLSWGSYSATALGESHPRYDELLHEAAARYSAVDYFGYDPANESPPHDVPDTCCRGSQNTRGTTTCRNCGRALPWSATIRFAGDDN